jgi:hypothetical protein
MQAGKEALDNGDHQTAHDLWREAATLDPYNEKVWLALYRVISSDDDRIVCLQNIIAINPANVKARRRLNVLEEGRAGIEPVPARVKTTTMERVAARAKTAPKTETKQPRRRMTLARALFIAVVATVLGVIGGVLASILAYGRG